MKIRNSKSLIIFNIIAFSIVGIVALFCLLPFLLVISGSLTDNNTIITSGYSLIPKKFSLDGYKAIFLFPKGIISAYRVTFFNTVIGTIIGLFVISMAGYVLQRKDFKYRDKFSFFFYFTTIFGGGLIPWYIMMVKYLHLQNSNIVLIFPLLMTPFFIILMRTFINFSVPEEIVESAKIDGAGEFMIYFKVVMPLLGPGLATVGLFLALNYWNDWFLSSMFITSPNKYELQFYLYNMMNNYETISKMSQSTGVSLNVEVPTESVKLAMAVVVTGPIIFLYPFIQKYFVKGITIGAVKG